MARGELHDGEGNKAGHRRFGNIRRLPSGRYQASYLGPDGQRRNAPETFERKSDADRALSLIESQMARGEWTDPERGKVKLVDYAETWITERPGSVRGRPTITVGCSPSTSSRTSAGCRSASCRPRSSGNGAQR